MMGMNPLKPAAPSPPLTGLLLLCPPERPLQRGAELVKGLEEVPPLRPRDRLVVGAEGPGGEVVAGPLPLPLGKSLSRAFCRTRAIGSGSSHRRSRKRN